MGKRVAGASEYDLALGVLEYLSTLPDGTASIDQIVKAVPNHVALMADDHIPSGTRPNEEIWEQRVRNIVSHHASPANFINLGYLENPAKGQLRITDAGRDYLKRELG
jgi:hypothetical protein